MYDVAIWIFRALWVWADLRIFGTSVFGMAINWRSMRRFTTLERTMKLNAKRWESYFALLDLILSCRSLGSAGRTARSSGAIVCGEANPVSIQNIHEVCMLYEEVTGRLNVSGNLISVLQLLCLFSKHSNAKHNSRLEQIRMARPLKNGRRLFSKI